MSGGLSFLQSVLRGVANGSEEAGKSILQGAIDAVNLPRDAYQGKIQTQPTMMTQEEGLRVANMAGNIGTGGFAMAKPAGSLGMFAGRQSKTADQTALLGANVGEYAGRSAEEIANATGWFKHPVDGKWKYEISDDAARATGRRAEPGQSLPAREVLQHEELYKAYPELADIPIKNKPGPGGYQQPRADGSTAEIGLDHTNPDFASIMLHEMQHAIQRREGFGLGANPSMKDITDAPFIRDLQAKYQDIAMARLTGQPGVSENLFNYAKYQFEKGKYDTYKRAAGEVESRMTQDRAAMTAQDRKDFPFIVAAQKQYGYEIPFSEQWLPGQTKPFAARGY